MIIRKIYNYKNFTSIFMLLFIKLHARMCVGMDKGWSEEVEGVRE